MSESIKQATARDYDGTVARVAGNIFSGMAESIYTATSSNSRLEDPVRFCVRHARLIVEETRRTEPNRTALAEMTAHRDALAGALLALIGRIRLDVQPVESHHTDLGSVMLHAQDALREHGAQ